MNSSKSIIVRGYEEVDNHYSIHDFGEPCSVPNIQLYSRYSWIKEN
jgi:hypothetical protein